jgi:hypothetical protein
VFRTAISRTDAEDRRPSDGRIRKAVAAVVPNLAKVGVEGSNPFARSKLPQGNQWLKTVSGAASCFPAPLVETGEAWGKR